MKSLWYILLTVLSNIPNSIASADRAESSVPLKTSCRDSLRVNFFGDFFVSPERFRKDSLSSIQPLLSWAHFNVVNFEGVVTDSIDRAFPDMPFALRMAPEAPALLASAGIRHVTRGNNHSMDFGVAGMTDTSRALEAAGIHFVGVGRNFDEASLPLILRRGKIRVAVLSFATIYPEGAWATDTKPGVAYPVPGRLEAAVRRAKERNDFVVNSFHWGGERVTEIRDYQRSLASLSAKQGATIILGHHAHIAQGLESVEEVPVVWGLGNFLFTSFGRGESLSLGLSVEFCKPLEGEKPKPPRWALTPLLSGTKESMYSVIPADVAQFRRLAAPYLKAGLMPSGAPVFLVSEGVTRTAGEWLSLP